MWLMAPISFPLWSSILVLLLQARAAAKDHLLALTEMYQAKHSSDMEKMQAQISDLKDAMAQR